MSQTLFKNWIEGDEQAFQELYQVYYPRIMAFATTLIENPAEGEDLAQETFVRLYRAKEELQQEGIENGRALIYTIVRRLAYQYAAYRRRWKRLAFYQTEIRELLMQAAGSSPEEHLASAEAEEYILLATNQLPEPQREVILLRHREHLTYEEIARVLRCSVSQLKSRLHYARKLLRGRLREMDIILEREHEKEEYDGR